MNKQAPSLPRLAAMVIFAFSCFGLLLFLWLSFGGAVPLNPKGYRFQVAFPEATQLAVEADVRVAGVSVGKVRAKRRDPRGGNKTLATIELDRRYAPINRDAKAVLRQKTLLGETYVELGLGTERAGQVAEGGRLDDERVTDTVELDEILDALDPDTRAAFRTWQRDLGDSIDNRGRDVNDAFGNLPGFVDEGGDLFTVLDQERQALRLLVRNTGATFGAITQDEAQLRNLIVNVEDVFGAIDAEREAFADTWRVFPTFLEESKLTLRRLQSFSGKAEPVLADLEPALRDLDPALTALGDLSPDLRRFFRDFDPLIDAQEEGLPASTEVLRGLRPLLAEVGPFTGEVNPILDYIGIHAHTLADMFANLGGATAAKQPGSADPDALGHYLRQFGPQGFETAAIHPNRLSSNRGNAFINPLSLVGPTVARNKIIASWDCVNAGGEKPPGGSPPTPACHVQQPFEFQGKLQPRFPHVERATYPPGR